MAQEYRPAVDAAEPVSTDGDWGFATHTAEKFTPSCCQGYVVPTEQPANFAGHETGSAELVPAMPCLFRLRQSD